MKIAARRSLGDYQHLSPEQLKYTPSFLGSSPASRQQVRVVHRVVLIFFINHAPQNFVGSCDLMVCPSSSVLGILILTWDERNDLPGDGPHSLDDVQKTTKNGSPGLLTINR